MTDGILFAILAMDKQDSKGLRAETRPDHLEFIEDNKAVLVFAGPFLDDQGDSIGSLYIVSVPSEDDARRFIASDPYSTAGLFQDVQIRRWRLVIDNIHG